MHSGLSEKLQACLVIIKAMKKLSDKKDIAELQVQYGATHERIFKMTFVDNPIPLYFQARNGRFIVNIKDGLDQDVELMLTTDTFLNIIHQRGKRLDPESNEVKFFPYTFYDAWAYGDIKVRGERATNACRSFLPIFDDMISDLHIEMEMKEQQQQVN